jgi:hypothetical protein
VQFTGSQGYRLLVSISYMPKKKRRTKKQPKAAPEPIAKLRKRRRRGRKPVAEPVTLASEPKTVMQLIFEGQRQELDRLNEEIQKKVLET